MPEADTKKTASQEAAFPSEPTRDNPLEVRVVANGSRVRLWNPVDQVQVMRPSDDELQVFDVSE
jgi:hypothetical protein